MQQTMRTRPAVVKPTKSSNDLYFLLTLIVGTGIGVTCMFLLFIVLHALGFICVTGTDCSMSITNPIQSPSDVLAQDCPPDELIVVTATPSPEATATPDIYATATAACAIFSSQFPGTPCPPPD